jgi:uncharacterized protein (DUF2236 family)
MQHHLTTYLGTSNFANHNISRPMDRLRTTMTYVYCMIYGTPEEKKMIVDWVHKAHSVVKGPDYTAVSIYDRPVQIDR